MQSSQSLQSKWMLNWSFQIIANPRVQPSGERQVCDEQEKWEEHEGLCSKHLNHYFFIFIFIFFLNQQLI